MNFLTTVCEQIDGLIEGGVDVILIETIFDTLNCKADDRCSLHHDEEARRGAAYHGQSHRERPGWKNPQRTDR